MIPKIIHYCWLSGDPIPEDLKKCMDSWKKNLSDYEFMFWNFDKFNKKSSKWVEQAFDSKKYAFAADYIRLYAIYNYGGIYLDMDIEVLKQFDDLLNTSVVIAFESEERTGLEAGCFGAEKGNLFIKDCLSYYNSRAFIKEDGSFDILPLPKIMAAYISEYPEIQPKDWHTFTNKSYKTGLIQTIDTSYAIHHFAGSWTSPARKKYDKKRHTYYNKYGFFSAKLLTFFALLKCLIEEGGIEKIVETIFLKLKK